MTRPIFQKKAQRSAPKPTLDNPREKALKTRTSLALAALLTLPMMGWGVASASAPSGLEVHEWGTFTTLNSSAGNPLGGLYVDASRLPAFVHGLPYFNFDPLKGWASLDRLRNVTVKMETPVLYFYAQKETPVDVLVRFNGGTISQWYPACYVCEANPSAPAVDFAQAPYGGKIGWKATVLAPGPELPYSTTASNQETAEWTAPRGTTANQLRGQDGEIEKFLFYRGIGNFQSTVDIRFLPDGRLRVKNLGKEDIPFLMVYERAYGPLFGSDIATVWQSGPMAAGAEISLTRDKPFTQYTQGMGPMDDFRAQLQKAGLTSQEAQALLNTWYNGYFIEGGLKAFWILPRAQVEAILPLTIIPAPDKLERVIVGRSEILTPEFEQALYAAKASDSLELKYGADKYRMAYADFLSKGKDWHMTTAIRPGPLAPASARGGSLAGLSWPAPGPEGWASPWFPASSGRGAFDVQGHAIRMSAATAK